MHRRAIEILRQRLREPLPGEAAQNLMAPSLPPGRLSRGKPSPSTRNSAVLITLYPERGNLFTIFIKRALYDGVHSGQIGLPGGKSETSDPNLSFTALREAKEEIGIEPSQVSVLGNLTPLFIPVSNMLVQPVVGVLPKKPELHLNLQEVEFCIHVGIEDLLNPKNRSVKTISIGGFPISAPFFSLEGETIWGATAMIISEFTELYNTLSSQE